MRALLAVLLLFALLLGASVYYFYARPGPLGGIHLVDQVPVYTYTGPLQPGDILAFQQTPDGLQLVVVGKNITQLAYIDGAGLVLTENTTLYEDDFSSLDNVTISKGSDDTISNNNETLTITDTGTAISPTTIAFPVTITPLMIVEYDIHINQTASWIAPRIYIGGNPYFAYYEGTIAYFYGSWHTIGSTNAFNTTVHVTLIFYSDRIEIYENGTHVATRTKTVSAGQLKIAIEEKYGTGTVTIDNIRVVNIGGPGKIHVLKTSTTDITVYPVKGYTWMYKVNDITIYADSGTIQYNGPGTIALVPEKVYVELPENFTLGIENTTTSIASNTNTIDLIDDPISISIMGQYTTPTLAVTETPTGYRIMVTLNGEPVDAYIWVYGDGQLVAYGRTSQGTYVVNGDYSEVKVRVEGPITGGLWLRGEQTYTFNNSDNTPNNTPTMPPADVEPEQLAANSYRYLILVAIVLVLVLLVVAVFILRGG